MSTPMIPGTTPSTPAAPAAAGSTEVAPDNFLLMLGQLLGAPVAPAPGKPATAATTDATLSEAEAATQDAALVTGVPVPVISMPMQTQRTNTDAAPIAATAIAEGKTALATDALLPKELLQTEAPDEAPQQPVSANAPHISASSDMSQQLRVTASADPGPTRSLHHPVGSSAWADELGTRMLLMSDRGQHSASLRLNPENLGPLEVRIAVRDDQASVWFGSAQADTRAAIEQALPRLRELFASQGLSLTDAGVHHEAPREQSRSHQSSTGTAANASGEIDSSAAAVSVKLGLVDAYA